MSASACSSAGRRSPRDDAVLLWNDRSASPTWAVEIQQQASQPSSSSRHHSSSSSLGVIFSAFDTDDDSRMRQTDWCQTDERTDRQNCRRICRALRWITQYKAEFFLSRVNMQCMQSAILFYNFCLPVRPMLVLSLNERIYRHIFYDQVGAGIIIVFQHHRRYKIPRGTPLRGAKHGVEKFCKSPFISETVRDRPIES